MLLKLAVSNFRNHKTRFALTAAAVALSVSLVVAVTSGYASAEGAARYFLNKYLGSTDAYVDRQGRTPLDQSVLEEIRKDPDVARVWGRLEDQSVVLDSTGQLVAGTPAQIIGITRPDDTRVNTLEVVAGNWFVGDAGNVAVIDQVASEKLHADVGGEFSITSPAGPLKLKVVGIIHKPGILAAQSQTIYVPLKTLQRFAMPGKPPMLTRIFIEFKSGTPFERFVDHWKPKLAATDPLLKLKLTRDNRRDQDRNLEGFHALSYLGGTVSMLAAAFIVFSALSMGVAERQRTLAMLRAIGMFRGQIGWLVIYEGLALGAAGVAIGVPLGLLWVKILVSLPKFRELLVAGVVVSWGGIALGVVGSMLTALAASFLPAYSAMRVSPLEAMTPLASPARSRIPWKLALLGLFLIGIDSYLMFGPLDWLIHSPAISKAARFYLHFVIGAPGIMIGFFLLAPVFVRCIEAIFARVVAAMMGLRYALLRQQLSSGIWRAAGTASALMVGLAILVVMNVQGNSMLNGWKLPDKFPDMFIQAPILSPLDAAAVKKIENTPGIKKNEVMPIAIASPEFANPMFAMIGAAVMPNATMFFGVDPDKAFWSRDHPGMMELDFRQGSADEARRQLKLGRHLLVTEEFHVLKGLNMGDKISLKTPRHGEVEYTIAGVVWSPGIDVIVSMQDMGKQFEQRTVASLFGSLADAREDFGVDHVWIVAANLDAPVSKEKILARVQSELGLMGMNVGDIRGIKYGILQGLHRLLLLVSTVAISAMAVASLGVTNTIMASIRSRLWEFGILRSIGVTRSQMLRLVLAEATLLGLVGCALGLSAGALMSINARGLASLTLGYVPPLAIPWTIVWGGALAVMLISLIASLWPAWSASRTQPLQLLQAGRAAS